MIKREGDMVGVCEGGFEFLRECFKGVLVREYSCEVKLKMLNDIKQQIEFTNVI